MTPVAMAVGGGRVLGQRIEKLVTPRFGWLAAVALAAYGFWLLGYASSAASGSDSAGYLNSARLLADGRLQGELRLPPELAADPATKRQHFMPLGFDLVVQGNSRLPPTYPVGMPLHLAVPGKVLGWSAGTIATEIAIALGTIALLVAVARELGIDRLAAFAGGVALAAFPVFLFTATQPLSDTLATLWCLAAVWTALRSRSHPGWAIAAGVAVGIAVLVRATNFVLLPALVVLLPPGWRRLPWAVLGGLPIAVWLLYYNHTLYGGALRSGYGPHVWEGFAASYAIPTLRHFAYWLAVLLPAILLLLPIVAAWRARSRALLALGLWFTAITGTYLFYAVSHETWWCLRFILPAVPALILAALVGLQTFSAPVRRVGALVIVVWAIAVSAFWTRRLWHLQMKEYDAVYPLAAAKAKEVFPANALVAAFAASGALYFYTDFAVLRADQIDPLDFERYAALARGAGRPIRAVLFDGFDDTVRRERMPGNWRKVATVKNVTLWELVVP